MLQRASRNSANIAYDAQPPTVTTVLRTEMRTRRRSTPYTAKYGVTATYHVILSSSFTTTASSPLTAAHATVFNGVIRTRDIRYTYKSTLTLMDTLHADDTPPRHADFAAATPP